MGTNSESRPERPDATRLDLTWAVEKVWRAKWDGFDEPPDELSWYQQAQLDVEALRPELEDWMRGR